jgi:glutamyl-tRNA reductase
MGSEVPPGASDGVNVETVNARAASVRAVSARDRVPAREGDET